VLHGLLSWCVLVPSRCAGIACAARKDLSVVAPDLGLLGQVDVLAKGLAKEQVEVAIEAWRLRVTTKDAEGALLSFSRPLQAVWVCGWPRLHHKATR
jgi:hypothetical protein